MNVRNEDHNGEDAEIEAVEFVKESVEYFEIFVIFTTRHLYLRGRSAFVLLFDFIYVQEWYCML